MNEREYIIVTDLCKLRFARNALADLTGFWNHVEGPGQGRGDEAQRKVILILLDRMIDRVEQAVDEVTS
jgi:hypothetical protein